MFNKFIITFVVLAGFSSCTGSRKYFKEAERLEKKGLFNEAAEYYLESLQRNNSNTDARIKLKSVGQKYVDNLSSAFFRCYNTEEDESALEYYQKYSSFLSKCTYLKVNFNVSKSYDDDYIDLVNRYCEKNYHIGLGFFRKERYYESLENFKRIEALKPNFKDLEKLIKVARCEPIYRAAIRDIEVKNYLSATAKLKGIVNNYSDYKDSRELFDLFSKINTSKVLVVPPPNSPNNQINETLLNSFINYKSRLNSTVKILHNPALQSNRTDFEFDLMQALRKATGANFFFVFDVLDKKIIAPTGKKESYTCFRKISENNLSTVVIKYVPSFYNSVTNQLNYSYVFRYRLYNLESMQSVRSENRNIIKADMVRYNEFTVFSQKSDIVNYFPYNPSNTPLDQQYNPSEWRSQFNARRELKSVSELEKNANDEVNGIFSDLINNYVK